jgi:hypothetical protein
MSGQKNQLQRMQMHLQSFSRRVLDQMKLTLVA